MAPLLFDLSLIPACLQLLQQAMAQHHQCATTSFKACTPARAALVGVMYSMRDTFPPDLDVARASMRVLSQEMPDGSVDSLLQDLQQMTNKYDMLGCLVQVDALGWFS
jgi:hypothetical protein